MKAVLTVKPVVTRWAHRCGHYELGVDAGVALRVIAAFTEVARAI